MLTWEEFMDQDIIDAQTGRIAELEEIAAAARRVAVAWPYYRELTDFVEFESACHDLRELLGLTDSSDR